MLQTMGFGGMGTLAWIQGRESATPDPGRLDSYRKNRLQVPSPWQTGSLARLEWAADVFGQHAPVMTRDQAMTIPGVARGRGILLSLIADKPMVDYTKGARSETQPVWLYRSPGWQGPYQRMARTLDDHIFNGVSLWGCTRGAGSGGILPILEAWHIPWDDWDTDPAGRICLLDEDGQWMPADESEVILIPSSSEGLLAMASRTLFGAVELESSWSKRAASAIPMLELHETTQSGITAQEAQEVVDEWAQARASVNGGIAYTPYNIEARALGQYSPDMFLESRNAVKLDIAAFLQIPGSLLDASVATASLTYVTTEGQASSLDTMTVPYWCRPIEDRLGQDDVSPMGHSIRFAWGEAYTEPQGPITITPGDDPSTVDTAVATPIQPVDGGPASAPPEVTTP